MLKEEMDSTCIVFVVYVSIACVCAWLVMSEKHDSKLRVRNFHWLLFSAVLRNDLKGVQICRAFMLKLLICTFVFKTFTKMQNSQDGKNC